VSAESESGVQNHLESRIVWNLESPICDRKGRSCGVASREPEVEQLGGVRRSRKKKLKLIFGLPWNVVDNKGPKMRKMGQMRLPWNVYENKGVTEITLECY
jgi:hypothetical protein